MVDKDTEDSGPVVQFKWNFPFLRMVSSRVSRFSSAESRPRDKIKETVDSVKESVSETEESDEGNDRLDDLKDRLDNVRSNGIIASQEPGTSGGLVRYTGGVFVPVVASIDSGQTLEWKNETENDIVVEFDDGDSLDLPAGESASRSFSTVQALDYSIDLASEESICGAVVVGDPDEDPELPCHTDVDREVFAASEDGVEEPDEVVSIIEPHSNMSQVADEKQEMKDV